MMLVLVPPGAIALTRSPWLLYSRASALVSCTTPPLLAQYAALHGAPISPVLLAVLMITPLPVRAGCGSAARQTWNVPLRLTRIDAGRTPRVSPRGSRRSGRCRRCCSTTSMPPSVGDRPRRPRPAPLPKSVTSHVGRRLPRRRHRGSSAAVSSAPLTSRQATRGALGGEADGGGPADARPGAGDEGHAGRRDVGRSRLVPPRSARRSFLSTLPVGLRGSASTISSCSGILCVDSSVLAAGTSSSRRA